MGDLEPRLVDPGLAVEEQVEIERPRALGGDEGPVPPEPRLDHEQEVEEIPGRQAALEGGGPVQETRLVGVAKGRRVDERRDRDHVEALRRVELGERGQDRRLAVAEVGAEADVCPGHRATLATLPGVVGRRLLAVLLVALCASGTAAAATTRSATEPLEGQEWWLADVGADRADAPGPGVPIAIVDSGTDPTHPEFADRPNTTFLNTQSVFGREEYHGTIVASVAAAPANEIGMLGVYPNAALELYDASSDPRGISDFSAVTGIRAAAEHCPAVINLSFGSTETDDQLQDAILYAVHNGCLVVAAAGNSGDFGSPATFPASWPHVFTVGATDEKDQIASFSTSSPAVDVSAPGVDILGAVPLSRNATGYQERNSGTSFSSPIVAAAAAWVWTLRPTLTATQLADILRATARDIDPPGFDTASGFGIVDIPAALIAPAGPIDPNEPNDDIDQVKPGKLFELGQPPLTTPAKPSIRIAAELDASEDPRDLYRIWVPPEKTVRVSVTAGGKAAARIWGPQTVRVNEAVQARRRDLKGPSVRAGKKGFVAYVEVLLTGRSSDAKYTLSVTAAKR
jgi:subtilisin family serine protease